MNRAFASDLPEMQSGRIVFNSLWFAWAACLAAAMALGTGGGHGSSGATAARMGSSVALVAAGWLAFGRWRSTAAGWFAACIALGMTLGSIGDFFNAGLLDFVPLAEPVLGGIIAFALGHIAYITGFVSLAKRAGLTNLRTIFSAVFAWQLVGLVGWYFVVAEGTEARALVWPALPYSLLLAGTAGITSGLALQDRRLIWPALGGALFLASDLILAFELFRGSFAHQTECVWLMYGPGQMLIVFSTIIATAMLRRTIAMDLVKNSV
ncbi:MAG: lysoplasmalogenase [Planctomycetia bacterium]|nr:lysoplasmalogenase [Planctomycetia bacterium]